MRDWLIKDFGWKLFSVLLAVAVWLTVYKIRSESETDGAAGGQDSATFGNVPVLIVSAAADVRAFRVKPAAVTVTVSGMADAIAKLQSDQIRVFVDLTDIKTGNLRRHVEVSMPSGLTLTGVDPQEVDVVVPPPHN